jgi:CRISPR/Cas system-associated endonuclease/helicase Cas3
MWDKITNRPQHFQTPYPFAGLNKLTYGVRLSEFVVINAPTGVGKTSLLKEIEYAVLTNPEVVEKGYGVGFFTLKNWTLTWPSASCQFTLTNASTTRLCRKDGRRAT